MLDVTSIDLGKLISNHEPFDLAELIKEIIERLQPQTEVATGTLVGILNLDKTFGE